MAAKTAKTAPHAPPPVDGPLTIEKIAAIHGIGVRTVRGWAQSGALGEPVGTVVGSRGGRPQKAFSAYNVLNHGMRTGRLDENWGRLDDEGKPASGRREFKPGYTIRPEPTRDLEGRRYFFLPHVAAKFGVDKRTPETWRNRRDSTKFPDPDLYLEGKPVWFEDTLTRWGRETERLDEEGNPTVKASA